LEVAAMGCNRGTGCKSTTYYWDCKTNLKLKQFTQTDLDTAVAAARGEWEPIQQLLNVRTAFLESSEKECADLLEALIDVAEREMEDGSPCWCMEETRRSTHVDYCQKARDLAAEPELPEAARNAAALTTSEVKDGE
jgi:hypothetical protein